METDEDLVRRACQGDQDSFGLLVDRHQKSVASFLLTVLRDIELAEDLAQDAFIKAFQNIRSFQGRSSFKTWVSHIAMNAAISHQRWARLRRWLSLDSSKSEEDGSLEERLRVGGPDELADVERRLEADRLMEKLGRREREISALRLEGYALGEIAAVLGISEGTVKSTLFDAVKKMRKRAS